jgi:hypothetical protein
MHRTWQRIGPVTVICLIRAAERWRSVKVTEFERRQMAAVRKELDQEYEAAVGLNVQPSKGGCHSASTACAGG